MAALLPFSTWLMSDAEALEMAQPEPWKETSATRSPSIFTNTWYRSPHRGFNPSALAVASAMIRKFRGFLPWSRMTSW